MILYMSENMWIQGHARATVNMMVRSVWSLNLEFLEFLSLRNDFKRGATSTNDGCHHANTVTSALSTQSQTTVTDNTVTDNRVTDNRVTDNTVTDSSLCHSHEQHSHEPNSHRQRSRTTQSPDNRVTDSKSRTTRSQTTGLNQQEVTDD
ncbi:hypothetical protein JOB18_030235 [Solea senegalensis]|uniref:Uncharacterized protein n=1 Tax=Solea senegalensis TaxID=28829 RepID=A0AAV6R7Y9_SOLSE|nr:hypothetical protein JOB18_030235 [Solea senegalensis]